ncbi:MAG: DinB family protein [Geodermatophilaceae bacterium]|nr:DinB family protein [Geodermatophilaceae bacterium]
MSRIELLLAQLDEAYGRLSRRLEGLTDEEYLWQPVPGGWSIRRGENRRWAADYDFPDPAPAPFTTIAWRLLHIADCKIMYHEYAYGEATLTFPDLEAPRTAALAIARLEQGQKLLRDDLTGLADDAALDVQVGTNWGEKSSSQAEPDHAPGASQKLPAWRIFWTMIEHDSWHGGEIGTMRDLYRHRSMLQPRGVARP